MSPENGGDGAELDPPKQQLGTCAIGRRRVTWGAVAVVESTNVVAQVAPQHVGRRLRRLDLPVQRDLVLERVATEAVGIPMVALRNGCVGRPLTSATCPSKSRRPRTRAVKQRPRLTVPP